VSGSRPCLAVVVCGAGPASSVMTLTGQAIDRGWDVQVVATPAALGFIDPAVLEEQTGSPVRSQYSPPGSPRSRIPDAIIVAPATYNTICKWAGGSSDTYALGFLAEMTGMGIPTVVDSLRDEGVRILLGPGGFEPHPPRTGSGPASAFPWHLALNEADRSIGPHELAATGERRRPNFLPAAL
jgi:hypothetical protein